MKKSLLAFLAASCALAAIAAPAKTPEIPGKFDRASIATPFKKFVLENGLTLLVQEDHSVPVVAVHLWYNVGARNEVAGKTGLAHLFEHLFSDGSEHHPRSFRDAMNELGATNLNGFTDSDRTLFFEDVPAVALERTLYLEADRMGFLGKQISQESLDRTRGIVQNEMRQGESQPLSRVPAMIAEAIYPAMHPYRATVSGSMEDLLAVSVEDARQWYRTHYGPNNCVLSLAGAVTSEQALELVKKYFGGIPPAPPLSRIKQWVPRLDRNIRSEAQDRVPDTRVYRIYHAPGWASSDLPLLKISANVLSGANAGRLDRRLVVEKKLVTSIRTRIDVRELASQFSVVSTVKPGVDAAVVEREIDLIVNEFLATGPTADELQRAKTRELAVFVRDSERVAARAGRLSESLTYTGKTEAYLDRVEAQVNATPMQVKSAANRWLDANHYTLIVTPYPTLSAGKETVDRSILPPLAASTTSVGFPTPQNSMLTNGLKVVLLERHSVPMVFCALVVDAGYATESAEGRGLASLAMELIRKGTTTRDAAEIVSDLDAVGARLSSGNTLDSSLVFLEALSTRFSPSLDLYADVILNPVFPAGMLDISRNQRIADIAQDINDPGRTGMNFVRRSIYGDAHPYSGPLSGFGFEHTLAKVTRNDVVSWHRRWFHPGNSTLIVSGDITMQALLPQLERTFGVWSKGSPSKKSIVPDVQPVHPKVYLINEPGAKQSVIVGAQVSEPGGRPEDLAIATVMKGFGGSISSRLNRNLRVDKQWSYNAWAALHPARGQRTLLLFAPVQTENTRESLVEITKEFRAIAGEKPIDGEELAGLLRAETLSLPGRFATLSAIENAAIDMVSYGYPSDYYTKYAQNLRALTAADLASAAKKYIRPDQMIWIVRGDVKKIEAGIRELNLGEIVHVDTEGRPVN